MSDGWLGIEYGVNTFLAEHGGMPNCHEPPMCKRGLMHSLLQKCRQSTSTIVYKCKQYVQEVNKANSSVFSFLLCNRSDSEIKFTTDIYFKSDLLGIKLRLFLPCHRSGYRHHRCMWSRPLGFSCCYRSRRGMMDDWSRCSSPGPGCSHTHRGSGTCGRQRSHSEGRPIQCICQDL